MKKEWETEPDKVEFEYKGFKCLILRHPTLLHLNGYVGLTENHQYYGKDCSKIDIDVHGGLTFAEMGDGENWPKGYYWIGFDTGHCTDYSPGMEKIINRGTNEIYKNIDYVTNEVKKLVDQLDIIQKYGKKTLKSIHKISDEGF